MDTRLSPSPGDHRNEEAKHWATLGDVALSMLLVFVLFILAQFLNYEQIFVQEEIERRKHLVAVQIRAEAGRREGIDVEVVSEDGLSQRIRVTGELVFEECRDDLRPTGRELLIVLGAVLGDQESYFESVQVEGHADRQGVTGIVCQQAGIEDNWQLSARRATEVVRLFSSSSLLQNARLSSVGRGEFHPSNPSDTTALALARDRRIEIVLRYSQEGILPENPDG